MIMTKFLMAVLVLFLISVPVFANYGTYDYYLVDPNKGSNLEVPIGATPYVSMACDTLYGNAWAGVRAGGGIDYIIQGGEDNAGKVYIRQIYLDTGTFNYSAIVPRGNIASQYIATGTGGTNVFYWDANMVAHAITPDEGFPMWYTEYKLLEANIGDSNNPNINAIEALGWDAGTGAFHAFSGTNPTSMFLACNFNNGNTYNDMVQSGAMGRWIVVGPKGIDYIYYNSATASLAGDQPRRQDLVDAGLIQGPIAYKAIVRNIGTGLPDDYIFARIKNPATPSASTVGRFYDANDNGNYLWNEWTLTDFPSITTAYTKLVGIGISNQCVGLRADGGVDLIVMNRTGTDAKAYQVAPASTTTIALADNDIGYIGQFIASQAGSTCGGFNRPYPNGDLNKDCIVNMRDIAVLAQNWMVAH
jgi:hypothetical protein